MHSDAKDIELPLKGITASVCTYDIVTYITENCVAKYSALW